MAHSPAVYGLGMGIRHHSSRFGTPTFASAFVPSTIPKRIHADLLHGNVVELVHCVPMHLLKMRARGIVSYF